MTAPGYSTAALPSADNTHHVKLLTIVDKLFRCGESKRFGHFFMVRVIDELTGRCRLVRACPPGIWRLVVHGSVMSHGFGSVCECAAADDLRDLRVQHRSDKPVTGSIEMRIVPNDVEIFVSFGGRPK